MAIEPIIAQIAGLRQRRQARRSSNLHELAEDEAQLPDFVRQSPAAMRYLRLLGPLTWDRFPERDLTLGWPVDPVPYAALTAAYLIKLDQGLTTVSALRRYLVEQPALVWLCGFRLAPSRRYPWPNFCAKIRGWQTLSWLDLNNRDRIEGINHQEVLHGYPSAIGADADRDWLCTVRSFGLLPDAHPVLRYTLEGCALGDEDRAARSTVQDA